MNHTFLFKDLCSVLAALVLSLFVAEEAGAYDERNFISEAYFSAVSESGGESLVKTGGGWFPYPAYEDRAGWAQLFGADAARIIKQGEKLLG